MLRLCQINCTGHGHALITGTPCYEFNPIMNLNVYDQKIYNDNQIIE